MENRVCVQRGVLRAGIVGICVMLCWISLTQTALAVDAYVYWTDNNGGGDGLADRVDRTVDVYNPAGDASIEAIVDADSVLPTLEPPELYSNGGIGPLRITSDKVYWAIQGHNDESFTNSATFLQSNLDGTNTQVLMQLTADSTIIDFDVDVANNRIYYTEHVSNTNERWVRSSDLNGSNVDNIVQLSTDVTFGRMGALTLDTANQMLYYTDGTYQLGYVVGAGTVDVDTVNKIKSYNIAGDTLGTVYTADFTNDFTWDTDLDVDTSFRGIEIDPTTGVIYFTNAANGLYGLQKVDFDGTDFAVLTDLLDNAPHSLGFPDRIAIDPDNSWIYFNSGGDIYRADFTGDPAGNFNGTLPGEWSYYFESGYTDGGSLSPSIQGLDTYSQSETMPELPPGVFGILMSVLGIAVLRLRIIFQKGSSVIKMTGRLRA